MANTKRTNTPDTTTVWGSPDYLKLRYDDIDTATELTRKTKLGAEIRKLVKDVSTPKDNLAVHRTYRISGKTEGGVREGVVVWISFGLNGNGNQADYFAALQRLVKSVRLCVFDAIVDAADDVADVLCRYLPAETVSCAPEADGCGHGTNADHRKQRGRTAPNGVRTETRKPKGAR